MTAKTHPPAQRQKKEPHVGIFWVVDGKPLLDSLSLSEAEEYGDFKTHPRSHIDAWRLFQQRGIAPPDVEYEEFPGGRPCPVPSESLPNKKARMRGRVEPAKASFLSVCPCRSLRGWVKMFPHQAAMSMAWSVASAVTCFALLCIYQDRLKRPSQGEL